MNFKTVLLYLLLCSALIEFGSASIQAQEKAESEKDKPALPLKPERNVQFTTDEVTWMSLDVSPDGNTIVFEAAGDLYTLPISGGKASRITSGMAYDTQPRFSPDGSRIVFVSDRSGSENIYLLDIGKTITDATKPSKESGLQALTKGKNGAAGRGAYISPEWTPDGKYIVTTIGSGTGSHHLWIFHVDGGKGVDLLKDKERQRAYGAAFGDNDRFVYFSSLQGNQGLYNHTAHLWQVAKYDRETGEIFQLTGEVGGGMRPAASSDGKWLVYASRYEEKTGFRLRDLESQTEKWLAYPVQRDDSESRASRDLLPGYSFLPDNTAIIASFNGKLYKVQVPSGKTEEIEFSVDINLDLGPLVHFDKKVEDGPVKIRQVRNPVESPDGKSIAFTILNRLYVRDIESGSMKRVTDMNVGEFAPAWSPDGNSIAFVTWSEVEGGGVYRVDPNGRNLRKLSGVSAYYNVPVWTPDGSGIVVTKGLWQQRSSGSTFNRIRGQGLDLVIIPADGGPDKLVSPYKGGGKPHFADSPDRLYLYESNELISMRLDGTDRRKHLKVTGGKVRGSTNSPPATEVLMGSDGENALVLSGKHVYKVTVPVIGGEVPVISTANPENATFPVKKLSTIGGMFSMNWSPSNEVAIWQLGNAIFRYNFADAEAFESSLAEKEPEEKDEEEPEDDENVYKPEQFRIDMEFSRMKGEGTIVFRGARLITMDDGVSNEGVIEDGAIIVINDRITRVGRSSGISAPAGAREIDVRGKTILPGFVDTHAHMRPARGVHRGVVWEYLSNLAYGVITTQDVQTATTDVLTYGDMVEVGELVGPRIFYTGPGVFSRDLIGSKKEAEIVLSRYSDYYRTNTIKQYVAGDRDVRQMIIMAAKEAGLMPTYEGALDMKSNFTNVIDGYPGHEHSFPIAPLYKDFYEVVARSGITYTPTLIVSYGGPWAEEFFYKRTNVHDDPKLRKFFPHTELDKLTRRRSNWFMEEEHAFPLLAEQANKIVEAGGRVGIGGHGQLQGLGYHWELWAVQSGGMTEMNALRCATLFGADAIGFGDDLGSLEEGKLADLVVLDENPLENIRNTTSTRYVMKNGLLYDANTLDMLWPEEKKLPTPYWQITDPVVDKGGN